MNHSQPRDGPIFIRVDPREQGTRVCPNGCTPIMLFRVGPKGKEGNACARCFSCGLLWEVTPQGLVIKRSQWLEGPASQASEATDAG